MAKWIRGGAPQRVKATESQGDSNTTVVTVRGRWEALKRVDPADYCPVGYAVSNRSLEPFCDGSGQLTVNCVDVSDTSGGEPIRTTYRIDMVEVEYDLAQHPHLKEDADQIIMWLATEESKRIDGNAYKYADKDGELKPVTGKAVKFCAAYMSGIRTFNRYYPVIEKLSTWKKPPGMSVSPNMSVSGNPAFSTAGNFETPPISLTGYAATGWYKSKDSWTQSANRSWQRTEQWTYTPEGSTGDHAWIYTELTP